MLLCVAQKMSAIDTSRHLENTTFPVDVTESVTRVSAFAVSKDGFWWRWLVAEQLLHYGPALCVCGATVGVALSVIVWIRLQRYLPPTLLYLLVASILELLPVYMHCGSYTLKQVIDSLFRLTTILTTAFTRLVQHDCGDSLLEAADQTTTLP